MAEWLQVSITVVSIVITIALFILQLARTRHRIRVRPRLDIVRIGIQIAAVVVVAALLGTGAPVAVVISLAVVAVVPGYVQGVNLEITEADGRLYAMRNIVAAAIWSFGLVVMQTAGLLRLTGVVSFGQATAWAGIGLAVGLFIGRRGPIAEQRRLATGVAVPAAMVGLLMLSVVALGSATEADAESAGDQWVLMGTALNPTGATPPDSWQVAASASNLTVVQTFGPGDTSGAEATFEASWTAPPANLVPGERLSVPVTVAGRVTGARDTQFYFHVSLFMIVNDVGNGQYVGAEANCVEPMASGEEYVCSAPQTVTGDLVTTVPSAGDEFTVGVSAENCGRACYVEWRYAFEAVTDTSAEPSDDATTGNDGISSDEVGNGDAADDGSGESSGPGADVGLGDSSSSGAEPSQTEQLDEAIRQAKDDTGIEPDEAMQAAIAGVVASLATGAISLVEAMERITKIFDEGVGLERGPHPQMTDPAAPAEPDQANVLDKIVSDDRPPDGSSLPSTGSGFEAEMADHLSKLPPPGGGAAIDEFLDWLERNGTAAADHAQYLERPINLDEVKRVWNALGGVVDDPSATTADELRHALADLLDRNAAAVPTWLISWAMRNPVAAGEMTVRMVLAAETAGGSELALIPTDVYRDITAARDAAVARGEAFTFGDGLIAGAKGQAIGWVVDGAGAAANAQRRAAGETLADIAARTQARAGADALEEGVETGLERLGRSVDPDDLADAARRNTDPDGWRGMQNEPPGSKIPPEHIRETGYTPAQAAELQRVAAEQNVIIGTRETNPASTRWIESGNAIPKPVEIKAKTVNEFDALIGGPPADKQGLVGFFEPATPTVPRAQNPELWARYDVRATEWRKLGTEMKALESAGYRVTNDGIVARILPDGTVKPFAGDIDAVALLDSRTVRPLSGERYREVIAELRKSGAMLQHGAETNVVNDIVAHQTQGLVRGTREYNVAFDRAVDKAEALGRKLDQNHLSGSEQVFWTDVTGHYRGAQVKRLSQWQSMTAGQIPTRIVDPTEIAAAVRPITRAIAAEADSTSQ